MKLKTRTETVIDDSDWDELVQKTYGRPYHFQQQEGCQNRGGFGLTVPEEANDFPNDTVLEIVNGPKMGVSFKAWLERDPKQILKENDACREEQWCIDMWWDRNFYPDIQMVANDLHEKGLLDAGEYLIDVNW